ncbi:MAG: ABC transporter permease [Acidobacteria bacterium]|nr:MAG: ABC transporter permease [Acidobacteriota bacterium]
MTLRGRRVWAVIEKEWAETARNRGIVWMMALIPAILVVVVLGTNYGLVHAGVSGQDLSGMDISIPKALAHLSQAEAITVTLNEQFFLYLLLIPITLPVYIAAYTIIGEKETRTLEPLLAAPVSTGELLFAKGFAAAAPAVVINWIAFVVIVVGIAVISPTAVLRYAVRDTWIFGMLLFSPLLALLSVLMGVLVSSRVNDPRTAQQMTSLFVMPLVLMSVLVLMGKVFLTLELVLLAAMITLVADGLILLLAVQVFQRETILTRWK